MQTPPDKVCVVVSGTQGEPMSALSRVAVDNHKNLSVETGRYGGAELAHHSRQRKSASYRMMNHLASRGADIDLRHYESAGACIGPRAAPKS